jgi:hypothetical protein
MDDKTPSFLTSLGQAIESRAAGIVLNVLIPVLVIVSLLLPPVSAQQRIFEAGYSTIEQEQGGSVVDPDGMQVTLLPAGLRESVRIKLQSVPRLDFLGGTAGKEMEVAAQALPSHLLIKSPVYDLQVKGEAPSDVILTVPVPNDAEPYETLDLYTWNGDAWQYVAGRVIFEDDVIESHLDYLPSSVAVMQTRAQSPVVSAELPDYTSLPDQGLQALAELNPVGLYLSSDYGLEGDVPQILETGGAEAYRILPTIRNWTLDGVVRNDLVDNMLVMPEHQQKNAQMIADLVTREAFAGADLDYRGINPALRTDYVEFVKLLADLLHASGKRLTVHVEAPVQIAEDRWDTGAYDWRGLGRVADALKFPVPTDPAACAPGGQLEALLWWAAGEVNRYTLQPIFSATSLENQGGVFVHHTYQDALSLLSRVMVRDLEAEGTLLKGDAVTVELMGGNVQFDPAIGTYWFTYLDQTSGQERKVWLTDAGSMAHRLALASRYNLGGVALESLWDQENDPRLWGLVSDWQTLAGGESPVPGDNQFSVVWHVQTAAGAGVSEQIMGLDQRSYTWTASDPGDFKIVAEIAANDGQVRAVGTPVALVVLEPTATPTPLPTATATAAATETPTPTPVPPTATPKPTAKPAAKATSPPAPPPVQGTSFDYGIQVDPNDNRAQVASEISGMGFRWVKFQVAWKYFETAPGQISWGTLDEYVNDFANRGLKVLLSVVKAPDWARPANTDFSVEGPPADPQTFVNFVAALTQRYSGKVQAIEIWNEQNLHYEWGSETLSAARYMDLLKRSYSAIKAVNRDMIVVSGALTPTGAPAPIAIDDIVYLEQMYQNGLKSYSDAIGAHPSGFNCPPDGDWRSVEDPTATYRGPFDNRHHSWCFRGTMEGYRNVMLKYGDGGKRIWPTEFGWASGWTGAAGYEYANDNTLEEQAQWTVRSYEMMKKWGWVGVAFLWNLNFGRTAAGSEMAQWGILGRPAYAALAGMPK